MATYPAIEQLKIELERGRDVSSWLSGRVRNRKTDAFVDLMFNDWQISHFHLGYVTIRDESADLQYKKLHVRRSSC